MVEMVELVIKIPEEAYKTLESEGVDWLGAEHILNAVANGTPIPKGHGDLIDRDELIETGVNKCFCDWYDEIKSVGAIIEADEER